MIKAVIFDMDGTIVDDRPAHQEAWLTFAKSKGVSLTQERYFRDFRGRTNREILPKLLGKSFNRDEATKIIEEKESLFRSIYTEVEPVAGFFEIFKQIRELDLKVGLATTAPEKNRDYILGKLGIKERFDTIVGDEDIQKGKPEPEIYLKTAKLLSVSPEECLVFEDSIPGVVAGKAAGMSVIAITTTNTPEELSEADSAVKDFTQVDLGKLAKG